MHRSFEERQIYRIDHYLGKETVQNIFVFRFANAIFEPVWTNRYVDHVQITVAESLGVEHRAAFYEETGVVRDIVQNHLLQVLALVAMEPPAAFEADAVRDEKTKVLRATRPLSFENTVRGQYGRGFVAGEEVVAYSEEEDVPPDSNTPTFIAAKLEIDNWRWAGHARSTSAPASGCPSASPRSRCSSSACRTCRSRWARPSTSRRTRSCCGSSPTRASRCASAPRRRRRPSRSAP